MENNDNINDTERGALLKEAVDIILTLDDAKLKILLERMGFDNEANCILQSAKAPLH